MTMKKNRLMILLCVVPVILCIMDTGSVNAFQLITAQEAFDMVQGGQATVVDVRTIEEYVFLGSPALESGGDPIAYLIPLKLFKGIDGEGKKEFTSNPDFDALVDQTFGDAKDQALIMMCACGIRSTLAAERLESRGYTNVYEIDNPLLELASYPGGHGGFQGSCYKDAYEGYTGYPGRMEHGNAVFSVETVTSNVDSLDDSVSWMDTGLPVTFLADPDKIPKKAVAPEASEKTKPRSQSSLPFFYVPWMSGFGQQPYLSMPSYYAPSYTSSYTSSIWRVSPYGGNLPALTPYQWNSWSYPSTMLQYTIPTPNTRDVDQSSCGYS